MMYAQITSEERYMLAALRTQDVSQSEMARVLGRHRSSISREFARNACLYDRCYRPSKAQERTNGRRSRSRRNRRFTAQDFTLVEEQLIEKWSPEQISGKLAADGVLSISHETIYRYIWEDKAAGGLLFRHLRCSPKIKRKRYGSNENRGRLTGKRHISTRPDAVETRQEVGHWEIDTVHSTGSLDCVLTLVERVSGLTLIGKLKDHTVASLNKRLISLIRQYSGVIKTITADNGTEFHGYRTVEARTGVVFYFATPYHSWERGTNENTNGLIRQYLPKRTSMADLSQRACSAIAHKLNTRPRKRHCYKTPQEYLRDC